MVNKKHIIDDLKKFNEDLDKHLPKLNLDFIENADSLKNLDDDTAKYLSLLSSNIVDLRTEMALLRKNLSGDVEGMVLRQVSKFQQNFMNQINAFYSRAILELKESFGIYVREANLEIVKLKKDLNEAMPQIDFLSTSTKDIHSELELMSQRINSGFSNLIDGNQLMEIGEKLDILKTEISNKNNYIETNILNLNKKIIGLEDNFLDMKNQKFLREKQEDKLSLTLKTPKEDITLNLKDSKIEPAQISQKTKNNIIENKIPEKLESPIVSNVEKILEIEKRIEKLNSLR